jgi:glycosyltransferase involved in cell wall biosynthesis
MKPIITFLLPAVATAPVGGYKVVFEYANRLVADGYSVNIVFTASYFFLEQSLFLKSKSIARYIFFSLTRGYQPYHWFDLNRRVKLHWVKTLNEYHTPKSDIYIATAAQTAIYLNDYKKVNDKNKFYLVQGYESWIGEERFLSTLRLSLNKITISTHLYKAIANQGQSADLIYNGFDFSYFKKSVNYDMKNKFKVSMLYHSNPLKGCDDGIMALKIVKKKFPQLKACFFGTPKRPLNLPVWIEYFQTPNKEIHNDIYNESAIFIGPSHSEGFCLTPPEAMQCGCAVVCTDIGGYADVCKHEITALVSHVKDIEALAQNIIRLIEDDELRFRISEKGYENIKQFTWERAYSQFKLNISRNWIV